MSEIAICNNRHCSNFGHITTLNSVHDGWERDDAFGCPKTFEVMKNVTECCESEDFIERDYEQLTDVEIKELEELECQ